MNTLKNHKEMVILLFLAGFVLFYNLGSWGVTETSEARYAEISYEIYTSGDYLHPTLLNIGHYHKPPVTYWITAVAYTLFGTDFFAVRFFLQLALLTQLVLIYAIGLQLFNSKQTAFYAAAIYFSLPGVIMATRGLTTDLYLTTFVLASIYCWLTYRNAGKPLQLYLFYLFLALGFLTKGPVVFIVPLIVVFAYSKLNGSFKKKKVAHHLLGILLFLVVASSWFVFLYLENEEFLSYFLIDHTLKRFATDNFGRNKPFWFYLVLVPITSFPWFFMLFAPFRQYVKDTFGIVHFLAVWVFVPLLFFSLSSSKLILYVLPLYSGIALGAAYLWNSPELQPGVWFRALLAFILLVTLALTIYPFIDESIQFNGAVYFFLLLLFGLFLIALLLQRSMDLRKLTVTTSFAFTSLLIMLSTVIFQLNPEVIHDERNVAQFIQNQTNADHVYVYNERLPSLAFDLHRDIISIDDGDSDLDRELQFEKNAKWQKYLIKPTQVHNEDLRHSVVVLKDKEELDQQLLKLIKELHMNETNIDGWKIYY